MVSNDEFIVLEHELALNKIHKICDVEHYEVNRQAGEDAADNARDSSKFRDQISGGKVGVSELLLSEAESQAENLWVPVPSLLIVVG